MAENESGPELTKDQAAQVLSIRAMTLEECAEAVDLDRPDLARKWRQEAEGLRNRNQH
jgi:hypothetical protein